MSEEIDRAKELLDQGSAEVQRRANLENSAWNLAAAMRQWRMEAETQVRQLAYNWGVVESKSEVVEIGDSVVEPVGAKPTGPMAS